MQERTIPINEVKPGDKIRFEGKRKHIEVTALKPVGDAMTMFHTQGSGFYLRYNTLQVHVKINQNG